MNDNKPIPRNRGAYEQLKIEELSDLRDQFAMSAMNGCLSHDSQYYGDFESLSEYCYKIADHMLAARAKDVQG